MSVRVSVSTTRLLSVSLSAALAAALASAALALCAASAARAQTQSPPPAQALPQPRPVIGFVSSYEILRTARAAGFDPLAPPLRDGTTYVLRATDFRGILMRVVLDARTGVIRDVTRIVPADSGRYGMMSSPYGPPPYGPSPYDAPPYDAPPYGPPPPYDARAEGPPAELAEPAASPKTTRPAPSAHLSFPPLPRPRPGELTSQKSRKPDNEQDTSALARPVNAQPPSAAGPAVGIDAGAAPVVPAAPGKTAPAVPLND